MVERAVMYTVYSCIAEGGRHDRLAKALRDSRVGEIAAERAHLDGDPDGLAVDSKGGVWVTGDFSGDLAFIGQTAKANGDYDASCSASRRSAQAVGCAKAGA